MHNILLIYPGLHKNRHVIIISDFKFVHRAAVLLVLFLDEFACISITAKTVNF